LNSAVFWLGPVCWLVSIPDKDNGHFEPKLMIFVLPARAGMTDILGLITVFMQKWN
jgi:hypothetical protein